VLLKAPLKILLEPCTNTRVVRGLFARIQSGSLRNGGEGGDAVGQLHVGADGHIHPVFILIFRGAAKARAGRFNRAGGGVVVITELAVIGDLRIRVDDAQLRVQTPAQRANLRVGSLVAKAH